MALALMHSTLGRVAMDFLIWHTSEFNFIRIPDRLSITSSISPQMRIPYVLEFIHGTSGLLTGRLMEALAITKTASDQLEMATMLPAEFWQCADESVRAINALIDTIDGLEVNKEQMEKTANAHWAQASTLVGYFVKEKNLSYRSGHQVVALLMKTVADGRFDVRDVTPEMVEQAAHAYLGRKLGVTQDVLNRVFDARYCVEQRHYRGGTAPERVREHVATARQKLSDHRIEVERLAGRVQASRDLLNSAFAKIQEQYT
jgi:argininosuccinate lyase